MGLEETNTAKTYVVTRTKLVGHYETRADKYDGPEGPSATDVWRNYWAICDRLEKNGWEIKEQQDVLQNQNLSNIFPPAGYLFPTRSIYSLDGVIILNDLEDHFGSGSCTLAVASQKKTINDEIQRALQESDPCIWQTKGQWAKYEPRNVSVVGSPELHFSRGYFEFLQQHAPSQLSCETDEVKKFLCRAECSYGRVAHDAIKDVTMFKALDNYLISLKVQNKKDSAYDLGGVNE